MAVQDGYQDLDARWEVSLRQRAKLLTLFSSMDLQPVAELQLPKPDALLDHDHDRAQKVQLELESEKRQLADVSIRQRKSQESAQVQQFCPSLSN